MKYSKYLKLLAISFTLLFSLGTTTAQDSPVIGLVMKSLGNDFFRQMEDGAKAHADSLGNVELITLGIQNETDLEAQIALVENLIAQKVDAIVIAPADSRALVPVLLQARKAGITVVNIDVRLDEQSLADAGVNIPYVGPDNAAAAKMVGEALAKKLGKGGKVILLIGNPGADNAIQRANGFTAAAEEGGLELVASQSAHWETEEAFNLVTNLLTANPSVQGIMASNDSMAIGAVRAVASMGVADQVTIVGFDNIPAIQPMVCDGEVLVTLDQFGARQAADGIDVALEMIQGTERSGWIKIPVELITRDKLNCK